MKNNLLFALALLLLISCRSRKKYNEKLTKTHTVEDLQADVDFLFDNLDKNFPRLYGYISKKELNEKVEAFKSDLQPMTSAEFYHELIPLISEIRQGHLFVRRPFKIWDKEVRKKYRKAKSNFNDLDFALIEDSVYIEEVYSKKDSTIIKSKLLAIDSTPTHAILRKWEKKLASDGFNTTFQKPVISDRIIAFYGYDMGRKDSIMLKLKKADSIFYQKLKYEFKKEKSEAKIKDTASTDMITTKKEKDSIVPVKKLTRAEKKLKKKKRKEKFRDELKRGYSRRKKTDTREFRFVGKDSNIAYLKIRSFSGGNRWSKKFYEEKFHLLDSLNIQHLVLDLQDNTGGSLNEVGNLYSYLAEDDFQFIKPMEAKKRLILTKSLWSGKPSFVGHLLRGIATPFTFTADLIRSKRKKDVVYVRHKWSKIREPKLNAFDGKIYVLINGLSFSASSVISSNLHGSARATFIGEETGGAYNGTVAGLKMSKFLPNTNIAIPFWMMHLETPYKDNPNGYGIKPDIEVKQTLEDFYNDENTALERALLEIESKN